jgi:hypothetical protein
MPHCRNSKKQACSFAKPWITKGLLVSITKKNKLYKSYLKNRNDYYFSKYKIYRNKLKHLLIISKKSYYIYSKVTCCLWNDAKGHNYEPGTEVFRNNRFVHESSRFKSHLTTYQTAGKDK